MEVFNEFCVLIAIYHLIAFTELFYDPEMKFNVGFSLIAVVLLYILVNTIVITV